MIERIQLKNQLSFKEVDVKFSDGLNAFTGPSGAGKSVFMQAILSLFGQGEPNASCVEATITDVIDLEKFGLTDDDVNIFKYIKQKSTRYFINTQSISKKSMADISKTFLSSLMTRDSEEFENSRLITLMDALVSKKITQHNEEVLIFEKDFLEYKDLKNRLMEIEEKEKKVEELKEFTTFEIKKIDDIDPKNWGR